MEKFESTLLSEQNRAPGKPCDAEEEYWHEGQCCLYCPAGTRVSSHCIDPHTMGVCQECHPGEFALKNGMDTCRQCAQCRDDQEMVYPCFKDVDTKCQCKEGFYCESPDCEVCLPCTKRCPEGAQVLQECSPIEDTVCGVPGTGHSDMPTRLPDFTSTAESSTVTEKPLAWLSILPLILVLLVFVTIYCFLRKRKRSHGRDEERSQGVGNGEASSPVGVPGSAVESEVLASMPLLDREASAVDNSHLSSGEQSVTILHQNSHPSMTDKPGSPPRESSG